MDWKLAEAKNRLSEVVTRAATEGPQTIRRHDATVVVITQDAYRTLTGEQPSFRDWLLYGPRVEGLELPDRSKSPMRPSTL